MLGFDDAGFMLRRGGSGSAVAVLLYVWKRPRRALVQGQHRVPPWPRRAPNSALNANDRGDFSTLLGRAMIQQTD